MQNEYCNPKKNLSRGKCPHLPQPGVRLWKKNAAQVQLAAFAIFYTIIYLHL